MSEADTILFCRPVLINKYNLFETVCFILVLCNVIQYILIHQPPHKDSHRKSYSWWTH